MVQQQPDGVLFLPATPKTAHFVLPDDLPKLKAMLNDEAEKAKEFEIKTFVEVTISND